MRKRKISFLLFFPYATRPHGRLPKPPPLPKRRGGRASLSLWITVCEVGFGSQSSTEYNYPPSSEPFASPFLKKREASCRVRSSLGFKKKKTKRNEAKWKTTW